MSEWIEAKVTTVSAAAEAVSYFLERLGCAGVVLESGPDAVEARTGRGGAQTGGALASAPVADAGADAAGGLWHTVAVVKGYLPVVDEATGTPLERDARVARLANHLRRIPSWGLAAEIPELSLRKVRDEEWADAWKRHYHPVAVGERLVVHPTWEDPGPDLRDRTPIRLDPGMAFGTGAHPTTLLCLEALERLVTPGARVLDVGAGSGILSVAAARLGAASVVACDHDPVAVKAARHNVEANGVTGRVQVQHLPAEDVSGTYDCVVANLVADLLIDLANWIPRRLAPGGVCVGCGIVGRREADVAGAWARAGLKVTRVDRRGEWRAMEASC